MKDLMVTGDSIAKELHQSAALKERIASDSRLVAAIRGAASDMVKAFRTRHKVLWCGNGGSAADAQHLAAELSGRFGLDRAPLDAEALHVNTSYLTAVGNDYSFAEVFARAVRGHGYAGDVLVAISTSGNSKNVLLAADAARERGMIVIGLTGQGGGALTSRCDRLIAVPSAVTARIQESHILIGHIMCRIVEDTLFR